MTHSWKWKNCTFWKQFKKFLLHHKSWRMVKYFAVFWHLTQVFKVTSSESEGNIIIIIMKRVKEVATQSIVLVSSHILHHTPELRELWEMLILASNISSSTVYQVVSSGGGTVSQVSALVPTFSVWQCCGQLSWWSAGDCQGQDEQCSGDNDNDTALVNDADTRHTDNHQIDATDDVVARESVTCFNVKWFNIYLVPSKQDLPLH